MARTKAMLGAGARLSDYLSTGLLARTYPREVVEEVLRSCGRRSQRYRDLPAYAMVYYVMALPLYIGAAYEEVLRCVTQGMGFLGDAALGKRAVGKSGISQVRFAGLLENGTQVLFGVRMDGCRASEMALARRAIEALERGMLCLADRGLSGYDLWRAAAGTRAQLLWRGKKNLNLPVERPLSDGSYLSTIHPGAKARGERAPGIVVRVIDYRMPALSGPEPRHRLLTTLLDPKGAPAGELAALYQTRLEIENALEEFKTQVTGAQIVLRSKTPELVRQEFYGLWLAHFAIRTLIHEAALGQAGDVMRVQVNDRTRIIVK